MKKLLVTRNRQKSSEQGFSIAISTGFGLVIMMIGLTLMGRAMKDSSVSASQKIITQSDSAAQTGITRYTAFLSKYPQLAALSPTAWAAAVPGNTEVAEYASRLDNWQNITATGNNGQFKFVGYTPGGPTSPTTGTFHMEGRVGQTNTGTGNDIQTGTAIASAQTTVDVTPGSTPSPSPSVSPSPSPSVSPSPSPTPPVAVNPTPTPQNLLFPALWLRQGPGSTASTSTANNGHYFGANGLLEDTSINELYAKLGATRDDKGPLSPRTTLRIADFLPTKPAASNLNSLGNITGTINLPGCKDKFTTETINGIATKIYRYAVNSINTKGNNTVKVNTVNSAGTGNTTPQKVLFYLDGSITQGGSAKIENVCKNRNGSVSTDCDLNSFIIYGYGTKTATITPKICSGGGAHQIQGFIIAPEYVVGHGSGAGSGNNDPKGGFKGAVWANNWSNRNEDCGQHNGNQMTVEQMSGNYTWSDVANWTTTAPTNTLSITKQPTGVSVATGTDGVKTLVK